MGERAVKWGVYHVENGWLVDTGVGGTYSFDVDQAQWFESEGFARATLEATDIMSRESGGWECFLFVRLK